MNSLTEVATIVAAFWFIVSVLIGAWYVMGQDDEWND